MKKNFFFMATLLVAMTGCNKELQDGENELSSSEKVYMSFTIKTPTTRSATDNAGDTNSNANPDYEVGKDYENKVSKVDIVLTNDSGDYIVAEEVTPTGVIDNKYIAAFSSLDLEAETEYDVYIYANCKAPEDKDLHATSNATIEEMTQHDKFWMTSAYEAKSVTLPANMSIYTSPASPLNLGVHPVERSMARIDIAPYKNYDFEIEDTEVYVTLTEAAIINQSVDFYLLRRVSDDGTNNDWTVGGVETPNNYVVDVDWEMKSAGVKDALRVPISQGKYFTKHMWWPEQFSWISLPNETGNSDQWDNNEKDYKIWWYCKENTIPGIENQQKGFTTAVVFRGEISSTIPSLQEAMEDGENLYMFENVLYGPWSAVKAAAAKDDAPVTLKEAVAQVIKWGLDETALNAEESVDLLRENGFTGFSRNNDGKYFTYYYYWIRHNDNGDNAVMGNMEFAVVRNNVYKLCVENIYKLGHPTPGNPDPDPEDPFDPDESLNYYFNVTVDVLPWTVRVNNIEF